ncbi:hypothetical protein VIGAN_01205700 [Vigna angularis var. angularis]|uniref:Uncharacterized protein n=1 Tax=Vigna angularis var. angularis TaxID=157739 RepID=A0A0S3R1B7_PHAAN|nr:hypothetical protein VIGAN_01205700 [Vigna angularis var. angularis]
MEVIRMFWKRSKSIKESKLKRDNKSTREEGRRRRMVPGCPFRGVEGQRRAPGCPFLRPSAPLSTAARLGALPRALSASSLAVSPSCPRYDC